MANTRYTPTKNGYSITGSSDLYNRTLYGSHKNDDKFSRFFTFAGDAPQFMGALSDWTQEELYNLYAKQGTLISGLALTPGQRVRFYYSEDIDQSSRWFHNSEDVTSEFKNGWMEYDLTQISPWFPDVKVNIEAYPLLPDDGFLVHYKIKTDQRVYFVAGFGGITDFIARFEYKDEPKGVFSKNNCKKNTVKLDKNSAFISHPNGNSVAIGTSFDANFELGSATALESQYPSTFLGSVPKNLDDCVAKISVVIEPQQELDGYIVVLHNSDKQTLDKWLSMSKPITYVKQQIYQKISCISFNTPQQELDLTIAPTVIALDASWHKNSFHHGSFAYHAPFLGWRGWYAPTALGWWDRVSTTMSAHLNQIVRHADGPEKVSYVGYNVKYNRTPSHYASIEKIRLGDHNNPSRYHTLENSTGYLPYLLDDNVELYNMQECAFDMMLYYIEWSGDLEIAKKYFNEFCDMLDREERVFDPDNDGLYQNFLNTWISDGHSYNGAGCAQSSAYNYRANIAMAKIAKKLGFPSEKFTQRAEKIKKAVIEKLWIANSGVIAESLDTMGNCLIHPSPELSTAYLAIDCDIVDDFKAYTMLKYTENHIKSIETPISNGRLSYSSNWLPKKYSTCGIFPSENAHLALIYFKLGLKEKGKEIIDGIVDCYYAGKNPGVAAHIQSSKCTSDLADIDFTDVSGTYLRLMVEGLFGIRINTLDNCMIIAPGFPNEWDNASLAIKDISLTYIKKGDEEIFEISTDRAVKKIIKIPMLSTTVETVLLNGEPVPYIIKPAPNNSFIVIETEKVGRIQLKVVHGKTALPKLVYPNSVFVNNEISFEAAGGEIVEYLDINQALKDITIVDNVIYAKATAQIGDYTLFVRVKCNEYDCYIPANYNVIQRKTQEVKYTNKPFEPIDISKYFNCNMTELHSQDFMSPRPKAYSIGVLPNGRYGWEWNHKGMNAVYVDDRALRESKGQIITRSGVKFATPEKGENLACISMWDNYPTSMEFDLADKAEELAILFVATTNAMQIQVENVRITVEYQDGSNEIVKLVHPFNIDDWLVPALQPQNENYYFSDYNHAIVQRIKLDKAKVLKNIKFQVIANEVIFGVVGISICR